MRDTRRTGCVNPDAHRNHLINHIAIVIDGSTSMDHLTAAVKRVVRALIERLAARSRDVGQETRVSVYSFADGVSCLIWDADVLRLPDIDSNYRPHGNTALLDATAAALTDFGKISQVYGDHGFLLYVVTDGEENVSTCGGAVTPSSTFGSTSTGKSTWMRNIIQSQPDNVTVACLVPSADAAYTAKQFGFPAGNVQIWDATTERGVEEVGEVLEAATATYFTSRASGVRSSKSVFSTGVDAVNPATVAAALKPIHDSQYVMLAVTPDEHGSAIEAFVTAHGHRFVRGRGYYQMSKTETIQDHKKVMVMDKSSLAVYGGDEARSLIGLPARGSLRVPPDKNPLYNIFIQSTSNNRKLVGGTRFIYMVQ